MYTKDSGIMTCVMNEALLESQLQRNSCIMILTREIMAVRQPNNN
jgi:hypothetical protein